MAIKALGISDLSGFLLFYVGDRVLDNETRRLFEASISQTNITTLDTLLTFVSHRCKILDNIGSNPVKLEEHMRGPVKKSKGSKFLAATTETKMPKCLYCQHEHQLYRCHNFN